MIAVVLAAGEGRRLRPVTLATPKSLLPTPGFSMIERIMEILSALGISDVRLVVSHLSWRLRRLLGRGERWGVSISYVEQGQRLGTGHAFLRGVEGTRGEDFLLLYSDVVFPWQKVRDLIDAPAPAAAVAEVNEPWRYGVVRLSGGVVVDLVEKPPRGREPSRLVLAGAYHLDPDFVDSVRRVGFSPRGEIEITGALRAAARDGGIRPIILGRSWIDAGVPPDLLRASEFMLSEGLLRADPCPLSPPGRTHCGRVLLGSGASVGDVSVVGPGVRLGPGSRVDRSIILPGAWIGPRSLIRWAIISEWARIPEGTEILGSPESPAVVGPWARPPPKMGPGQVWPATSS